MLELADSDGAAALSESIPLVGTWLMWWGELHTPPELDAPELAARAIPLETPGVWNGARTPAGVATGTGFATYRLTVRLPPEHPPLGLRVGRVSTAHRLWLNGDPVAISGQVGTSAESSAPRMIPRLVAIPRDVERADLVVQVSNFDHRVGGLRRTWWLGEWNGQVAALERDVLVHGMSTAFLAVIGLLFLGLFLVHRDERPRLWFSLACLSMAARTSVASDAYTANLLLPGLDAVWLLRIEFAGDFVTLALAATLVRSMYPRQTPRRPTLVILGAGFVLAALALLGDGVQVTQLQPPLMLLTGLVMLLSIWSTARAWRSSEALAGLLFTGTILLTLASAHDLLRALDIIPTRLELLPLGFASLIVIEAIVLSKQYADSFRRIDRLSLELRGAHDELTRAHMALETTHRAVIRFVPFEFLELLGKRSIRDVQRGDHVLMDVSVMFCDLQGFTSLIEGCTPSDAFAFINDWLSRMEPEIYQHGGFIKEYLGDCIVALYPNNGNADSALQSCVAMQRALRAFEVKHAPTRELRAGFGLHAGPLVMGTIGGGDRLDTGAVGDVVNTASRVENMTRIYGATLLISETLRDHLEDPARYQLRELDRVRAKGKREAFAIYEVLDGLEPPTLALRQATRADYAAGLAAYRAGDLKRAKACFLRCLARDPDDRAPARFVERCEGLLARGLPEGWDGTTDLHVKYREP